MRQNATVPIAVSIILAGCSVLALAGCTYLIFASTPAALKRAITVLRAEVQEMHVQVEAIGQRWLAYKAELENLAEQIEDNLETVERKRKRAAAAASKAKREDGQEPQTPEQYRHALTARARQMGFDV